MKKLLLFFLLIPTICYGQFFGISIDRGIHYSGAPVQEGLAGTLGITTPIPYVPNIGATGIRFIDESELPNESDRQVTITTGSLFYHIPFLTFAALATGLGYGDIELLDQTTEEKIWGTVGEVFMKLGFHMWNTLELHGGVHAIETRINHESIDKRNLYSGTLYTVGLQIAL